MAVHGLHLFHSSLSTGKGTVASISLNLLHIFCPHLTYPSTLVSILLNNSSFNLPGQMRSSVFACLFSPLSFIPRYPPDN